MNIDLYKYTIRKLNLKFDNLKSEIHVIKNWSNYPDDTGCKNAVQMMRREMTKNHGRSAVLNRTSFVASNY